MKRVDPFYQSKEWEAIRKVILKRDDYRCAVGGVKCLGKKKGKPSPHIDHIIERKDRPDLALVPSNLQILCGRHHGIKTGMKNASKGKPEIGADGYPIVSA